jgi:hypothetical protein
LPPRVAAVLQENSVFRSAELVDAFFERQVDLKSKGRPSQTDLLAVIGIDTGLAVIAVEGKAGEPFGELVKEWLENTPKGGGKGSDDKSEEKSVNKERRLKGLCGLLGISTEASLPVRYQLLHRSASAILEAKRYRTPMAMVLVHSFSDDSKGFADFATFLRALGFADPTPNALTGPVQLGDVSLYAGWIQDKAPTSDRRADYLDALDRYAAKRGKESKRVRAWCDKRRSKV